MNCTMKYDKQEIIQIMIDYLDLYPEVETATNLAESYADIMSIDITNPEEEDANTIFECAVEALEATGRLE